MPVTLNSHPFGYNPQPDKKMTISKPSAGLMERPGQNTNHDIHIGLINNMADGALEATERQFLSLLDAASDGISIRLSLYSLPGVSRSASFTRRVDNAYSSVDDLWGAELDGLIVTGREPLTPKLSDEPYWESFTRVLDWARNHTGSTIWSCLAAHAAILYMDGIDRIKSDRKHCGVFDCAKVSDHPLTAGLPSRIRVPHSRWNGIAEDELTACGYRVLTRAGSGVDMFLQQHKSLFVFLQGHPEYESNTLLLEYRRDVGRYLRGESNTYPAMPLDYFDRETTMALAMLEGESRTQKREHVLAEVSAILGKVQIENTWNRPAVSLYRNWLEILCDQKRLGLETGRIATETHAAARSIPALAAAGSMLPAAVSSQAGPLQAQPLLLRANH